MIIEEIIPKLPKSSEAIKGSFNSCKTRKRFIEVDKSEFTKHLEKAKSDLKSVESDYVTKSWSWVVIKSYYTIHHAANALLVNKKGFFSKDHICTIIALKYFELIPNSFYYKMREIYAKFSDLAAFEIIYLLRKIGQYDVEKWKQINKDDADLIYSFAKEFTSFVEERCYE